MCLINSISSFAIFISLNYAFLNWWNKVKVFSLLIFKYIYSCMQTFKCTFFWEHALSVGKQ